MPYISWHSDSPHDLGFSQGHRFFVTMRGGFFYLSSVDTVFQVTWGTVHMTCFLEGLLYFGYMLHTHEYIFVAVSEVKSGNKTMSGAPVMWNKTSLFFSCPYF